MNSAPPDTVNCLGTATADLSEICLREVEKVVKAEKRRTVDEKTKKGYYESAEKKQKIGGMNHGSYENDLSGSGNGDAPEPETAGEPSPGDREIRHGAQGVSDGAPEGTYTTLLTENRLAEHLSEIDRTARDQVRQMTGQMAKDRGVNEQMKAENPMRWTQEMNSLRMAAEETVRHQLIEA